VLHTSDLLCTGSFAAAPSAPTPAHQGAGLIDPGDVVVKADYDASKVPVPDCVRPDGARSARAQTSCWIR
jgi:hypothetical protein